MRPHHEVATTLVSRLGAKERTRLRGSALRGADSWQRRRMQLR
jgi:hypothetical protein